MMETSKPPLELCSLTLEANQFPSIQVPNQGQRHPPGWVSDSELQLQGLQSPARELAMRTTNCSGIYGVQGWLREYVPF